MDPIKTRLRVLSLMLLAVMAAGILGFMAIEHFTFLDAVYYMVVTLATVGYGDVHPVSSAGKILAMVLIVMGVGTFLGVIANVTEMMLNQHERRIRQQKLHMVTSLFFNEIGTQLLGFCAQADPERPALGLELNISGQWSEARFREARLTIRKHAFSVQIQRIPLEKIRRFLKQERDLLLRLLENPSLLEKESFTELLRAVFHIADELSHRHAFRTLPEADRTHLAGDFKRAYVLLVPHWIDYMHYLKNNYPYLFSLAVRTNPLDPDASVILRQ